MPLTRVHTGKSLLKTIRKSLSAIPSFSVHTVIPALIIVLSCTLTGITLIAQRHAKTSDVIVTKVSKSSGSTPSTTQTVIPVVAPPPVVVAPSVTVPKISTPVPVKPLPAPNPIISNGLCTINATQAPDLISRAQEMVAVCKTVFPQIEARLTPSPYPAPHQIVFDYNQYAAYVQAGVVHVSIDWLRNDTYDPGVIPHELTHVVQNYDGTAPSWITEGIATYMSYKLGYSIGIAHCNTGERYTSGYGCAASLFNYTERLYKSSIVKDVHMKVKADTYTDAYFQTDTGKSLSTLYAACLKAECKGGTP